MTSPASKRKWTRLVTAIAVLLLLFGIDYFRSNGNWFEEANPAVQQIVDAYRAERSGVMVESSGNVLRLLADDNEGSRHQRFIVRLEGGHTILISHNIDLAERIPIGEGDLVSFRGQYEWNERGGVVHWTHHDPGGRRQGGWIEHSGRRYR